MIWVPTFTPGTLLDFLISLHTSSTQPNSLQTQSKTAATYACTGGVRNSTESRSQRLYYRDHCLPACQVLHCSTVWVPLPGTVGSGFQGPGEPSLAHQLYCWAPCSLPCSARVDHSHQSVPLAPLGHPGRSIQTGQCAVTWCKGGRKCKLSSAVILRQHTPAYPNASSSSTLLSLPATVISRTTPLHTRQGSEQGSANLQAPPPSAECPRTSLGTLTKGRGQACQHPTSPSSQGWQTSADIHSTAAENLCNAML